MNPHPRRDGRSFPGGGRFPSRGGFPRGGFPRGGRDFSRGSGQRRADEGQRAVVLGFKALEAMQDKSPDEIVLDLTSARCFPATEDLLTKRERVTDDTIFLITKILARACSCDSREYLFKLLNLIPQSMFLNLHVTSYIRRLPDDIQNPLSASKLEAVFKNLMKLFSTLMQVNPSCYSHLPLLEVSCVVTMQCDSGNLDGEMKTKADELMKLKEEKVEELKKQEEEKKQKRRHPRDGICLS